MSWDQTMRSTVEDEKAQAREPRPPRSHQGLGVRMSRQVQGWILNWIRRGTSQRVPRLQILERIALAPRHTLALVESEGRRFLVATSPEGAPVFHSLDEHSLDERSLDERSLDERAVRDERHAYSGMPVRYRQARRAQQVSGRVSW
jgi:flagellar biogenesis protein FliO